MNWGSFEWQLNVLKVQSHFLLSYIQLDLVEGFEMRHYLFVAQGAAKLQEVKVRDTKRIPFNVAEKVTCITLESISPD